MFVVFLELPASLISLVTTFHIAYDNNSSGVYASLGLFSEYFFSKLFKQPSIFPLASINNLIHYIGYIHSPCERLADRIFAFTVSKSTSHLLKHQESSFVILENSQENFLFFLCLVVKEYKYFKEFICFRPSQNIIIILWELTSRTSVNTYCKALGKFYF